MLSLANKLTPQTADIFVYIKEKKKNKKKRKRNAILYLYLTHKNTVLCVLNTKTLNVEFERPAR